MTDSADQSLSRLRWQCRRGLLELDCIFEDYLDQQYASAAPAEQAAFSELTNEQDPDLQAWLLHGDPCPKHFQSIVSILRREQG